MVLGPMDPTHQLNGISIETAVFFQNNVRYQRTDQPTDRQTDRTMTKLDI